MGKRTASSNNLIALLEQSFPGIRKCFDSPVRSDGTQKWLDFAHTFWYVDCVRKQSLNAFSERCRKWCKRHGYFFKQSNAEEVYSLAKNAVVLVPKSEVTKVLVQEAANQLASISRSVETYRAEMERLASMLPEYPVVMEMYSVAVKVTDDDRYGFHPCQLASVFSPVTGDDLIATLLTRSGNSQGKHTVLLDALNGLLHGIIVTHSEKVVGKGV